MNFNEYFNLGAISKVFSFKGEVILRFDVNYPQILNNLKTIFVDQKGTLVPYIVEDLKFQKKNFAKAKLKGVDTEEQAKKIVRADIYLPDSFLPKLSDDEFYFHELDGFEIFDELGTLVGTVNTVFDLPANPMIETTYEGKDVLIPLNLLIKVDKKLKQVHIEIPNGLLTL